MPNTFSRIKVGEMTRHFFFFVFKNYNATRQTTAKNKKEGGFEEEW